MRKIVRFLKEVRAELRKVVWPTRLKAARLTVVVVIVTAVFGAFIAGVDFGLNKGIEYTIDTAKQKPAAAPSPELPPDAQPPGLPPGANVQTIPQPVTTP